MKYQVVISWPDDMDGISIILDWADGNLKNLWDWGYDRDHIRFFFWDSADATAFKLRWL